MPRLAGLVFLFLALQRVVFAILLPITVDGSYAFAVSRDHSLSYFDHPPLAFGFARAAADLFGTEHLFIGRLPYIVMAMATAWLLYDLTRKLFGERAGVWALVAYATAPYFAQIAGVVMLPDVPLNMFLLASARVMLPGTAGGRLSTMRWALAGAFFGCACLSKYNAFLILASGGLGLLALREGRRVLRTSGPWVFLLVVGVFFTPVLVWNSANDWVSFKFHMGRTINDCLSENQFECVETFSKYGEFNIDRVAPFSFVPALLGQLYYLSPAVFLLSIYLALFARSKNITYYEKFLLWLSIPSVLFFNITAIVSKIYPHWPMSGFMFMLPIIGLWCARNETRMPRLIRVGGASLAVLAVALNLTLVTHLRNVILPATDGRHFLEPILGWHDTDWAVLKRRIAVESATPVVLAQHWYEAGYLAYYLGPEISVGVFSPDAHHFAYFQPAVHQAGDPGLAVRVVGRGEGEGAAHQMLKYLKDGYTVTGEPEIITDAGAKPVRSEMVIIPVIARRALRPVRQEG